MKCWVVLSALAAFALPSSLASAAELPPIKVSPQNQVPACVTPGRLMSFLTSRNDKLQAPLDKIAVEYMRHGEALGLRWDYTFFQMVIETGYLTHMRNGTRKGDVKPTQNNFAGIGATGRGAPGDSFPNMATGVLAHLQHVAVYAGDAVDNPVAERTRKIIEWKIGDAVKRSAKGPVTFSDLARKWAANRDYADAIDTHARRFYAEFCRKDDPRPELVAEARGETSQRRPVTEAKSPSVDLARRAIEDGKAEGDNTRKSLGAANLAKTAVEAEVRPDAAPVAKVAPGYAILNTPKADAPVARADRPSEKAEKLDRTEKTNDRLGQVKTASAAAGALKHLAPPSAGSKCRVFTASYGGQRAVLIRATGDGGVNYTVLDVNEGAEKREADAYIAAYARGGAIAGDFSSQTQALDKAFELCPEG